MKLSSNADKLKKSIIADYGIDDDAGLAILQTALEAYDLFHSAQKVVDKDGLTVQGDRGGVKAHPLLSVIRDARAQFLAGLKALNLDLEPLQKGPGRPAGRR